jgi:multiple sugar transport system substrate-binding protein
MKTASHAELTGITWNHTRGYLPMVATAQRFAELNPDVLIRWEKRSLQQFADFPLEQLAEQFDLLVIDHPSIGEAAELDVLIPLEEHLAPEFLSDQAANTVGHSHASYRYNNHQYALAIDAATPIAGWRPDLLAKADAQPPGTWEELLSLARRGLVTIPAIPIDGLMHLFMMSIALGGEPFSTTGEILPTEAGPEALSLLRELLSHAAQGSLERNPIATWQMLAESDTVAYCPFAYGYSNYSRGGYAGHVIQTGPLVSFRGKTLNSVLGGAGLGVSSRTRNLSAALAYTEFVASPGIQKTLYTTSGGQPGHRQAWTDHDTNDLTNQFFVSTLSTLDDAWMRPRFPGFIPFQDRASSIVHSYLKGVGDETTVLQQLNNALQSSQSSLEALR